MLKCNHRGNCYNNPYCTRDGGYCDTWRWAWCKGVILGIFMAISIAWFAYGIVFAWQYAEDRVDLRKKVEVNQIETERRMDELEVRIKAMDGTIIQHWKWELREFEKLRK